MNVPEIINEAIAAGRTRFAFELLPPLKGCKNKDFIHSYIPLV